MAKRARDPVQFTLESAERIASVVREAETAPPSAAPLTFARAPVPSPSPFRFAYYTATSHWASSLYNGPTSTWNTKQVMFASGGLALNTTESVAMSFATGQTAMCINNFQYIPLVSTNQTAAKMLVLVSKLHGMWRLVGASQ